MSARIEDVLAEHRLMFWTVDHVWGNEPESSRTAPRCSCGVLRSGGGSRESWASQVEWWERHVATALRAEDPPAPADTGDGGARTQDSAPRPESWLSHQSPDTDKGTPCQKGLNHGGGHWFMNDDQYACRDAIAAGIEALLADSLDAPTVSLIRHFAAIARAGGES